VTPCADSQAEPQGAGPSDAKRSVDKSWTGCSATSSRTTVQPLDTNDETQFRLPCVGLREAAKTDTGKAWQLDDQCKPNKWSFDNGWTAKVAL
jgi:hypothetical protein